MDIITVLRCFGNVVFSVTRERERERAIWDCYIKQPWSLGYSGIKHSTSALSSCYYCAWEQTLLWWWLLSLTLNPRHGLFTSLPWQFPRVQITNITSHPWVYIFSWHHRSSPAPRCWIRPVNKTNVLLRFRVGCLGASVMKRPRPDIHKIDLFIMMAYSKNMYWQSWLCLRPRSHWFENQNAS